MLSVFFCFPFVLFASLIPETKGQCRELRFTSAPIHGCRLKNHVIRTIRVSNEDICEWQCYLEPNCVSYNFRKQKEANGEHTCDLNNASYEHDNEHAGDLARNITYVYRGAENACAKKPCKSKATCQAGFTDRDYQCLCIPGFTGRDCENECREALGMERCVITDGQITASSEHNSEVNAVHSAKHGRLHFQEITNQAAGAWVANTNDVNQWLQIDLIGQYIVTRVATQGRNSSSFQQWVTRYKLQYGDDGNNFQYYREQGQTTSKGFVGNTDQDTAVYHYLTPPITARYIRFRPKDWYEHISMRVELYGCMTEKPRSMVICENHKGSISCENGKIIQVLDANYGRLDKISCTHEKMGDINCGSNNSLKVVLDKCNHKSSCELLASNGEFHGDPCGGTYKYLEVKYRCLE